MTVKTVSGLIKNIPNFFGKYCGIPSGPEDMPFLHFLIYLMISLDVISIL